MRTRLQSGTQYHNTPALFLSPFLFPSVSLSLSHTHMRAHTCAHTHTHKHVYLYTLAIYLASRIISMAKLFLLALAVFSQHPSPLFHNTSAGGVCLSPV